MQLVERAERPAGLDEFAAVVRASDRPAVVMIDRDLMRRTLDYLARLEWEIAQEGCFL